MENPVQDGAHKPALIEAVKAGDYALVRDLVNAGADVNEQEKLTKQTALLAAAFMGHAAIAQFLVDKGADVNHVDGGGFTTLIYAAKEGHYEIAKLAIDNDATLDNRVVLPGHRSARDYAQGKLYDKIVQLIDEAPEQRRLEQERRARQLDRQVDQSAQVFRDGIATPMPASSPLVLKKPRPKS